MAPKKLGRSAREEGSHRSVSPLAFWLKKIYV